MAIEDRPGTPAPTRVTPRERGRRKFRAFGRIFATLREEPATFGVVKVVRDE
jgi:hypothetical protein